MNRYIDSINKILNIYCNKLNTYIFNYKLYNNIYKYNNNNHLQNIISAFDNDYIFDNYCCSCLNPRMNNLFVKLNCGHEMHYCCFEKYIKSKYTLCPFCKNEFNIINKSYISKDTNINYLDNSFKINELYYN